MIKEKKDLIIAIIVSVIMWSTVAAIGYFVAIPSVNEAILQQQTVTNESIPEIIMKMSLIIIPAIVVYYLVMKKALYWSRA